MRKPVSAAQKGAVSVLVVITMLMLILFGLLALTTALAYERLGQKAIAWSEEYYELDNLAEVHIQMLDVCLARAEIAARGYISARTYTRTSSTLGDAAQRQLNAAFNNAPDEGVFAQHLFSRLYAYYAVEQLNALSENDDFFTLTLNSAKYASPGALLTDVENAAQDFTDMDLYLAFQVTEGDEAQYKNISVGIYVMPSTTRIALAGAEITGETQAQPRYRVAIWQEWQREAQPEGQEFWSGKMDDAAEWLSPDIQLPDGLLIDDTLPAD